MSTARELALELLPHFQRAVEARHVYTYGHYANAIGRNSARDSLAIGQAMHALGAACVLAGVPVAPLHYVERGDSGWTGIFESDPLECLHILPHYDLLYVTAREHSYTTEDFQRIDKALRVVFPKHLKPSQLSPHDLWHVLIYAKLKDGTTILELSLSKYRDMLETLHARRSSQTKPI
jgi:hypothetical protein